MKVEYVLYLSSCYRACTGTPASAQAATSATAAAVKHVCKQRSEAKDQFYASQKGISRRD